MAITVQNLRDGLDKTERVEATREALKAADMSMVGILTTQADAGNYLFFAAALDSIRRYVRSTKNRPGTYMYGYTASLASKMEELDTLVAGSRAGLPTGVENPFILSELLDCMGDYARAVSDVIQHPDGAFRLEQEEIGLLRALDGMYRHFELPEQKDWKTLEGAVPAMKGPVPMDDRLIDDLKKPWEAKKEQFAAAEQRRREIAESEYGAARLLLNSRQAALADDAMRKAGVQELSSEQARPYLLTLTLVDALQEYYHKYQDLMEEQDAESLKSVMGSLLLLDDVMAGADSRPEGETDVPDVKEVQETLTKNVWPGVLRRFGSYEPTSKVSENDSRLFRLLYEFQNTLGLPEKSELGDMRRVYNYVQRPNERQYLWSKALETAQTNWKKYRENRTAEAEAARLQAQREDADRSKAEQEEHERLKAQMKDDVPEPQPIDASEPQTGDDIEPQPEDDFEPQPEDDLLKEEADPLKSQAVFDPEPQLEDELLKEEADPLKPQAEFDAEPQPVDDLLDAESNGNLPEPQPADDLLKEESKADLPEPQPEDDLLREEVGDGFEPQPVDDLLNAEKEEETGFLKAKAEFDQLTAKAKAALEQAEKDEKHALFQAKREYNRLKEKAEDALRKAKEDEKSARLEAEEEYEQLKEKAEDALRKANGEPERKDPSQQAAENGKQTNYAELLEDLMREMNGGKKLDSAEEKTEEQGGPEQAEINDAALSRDQQTKNDNPKSSEDQVFAELIEEHRQKDRERWEKEKNLPPEPPKPRLQPPEPTGKTWGEFRTELYAYLQENITRKSALNPDSNNPGLTDIPYIRQLCQYLVAEGRFNTPELSQQAVDPDELYREMNQLQTDKGFLKLIKEKDFRDLMASRDAKGVWERIREASSREYKKTGGDTPYRFNVLQTRQVLHNEMEAAERPVKSVIDNVYTRLTNQRYNASLRKTGFLFFKPSDSGQYQTAVRWLGTLTTEIPLVLAHKNDTKNAIRTYLDDRMGVRRHAYGRQRWEQMMCAYRALEDPATFAAYCARINEYRGIKDPSDENYVHPNGFEAARTDLENPQLPMNETLSRLRQDYQKAAPADREKAQKYYFARVAAMRAEVFMKNGGRGTKPDPQKMWGTLVDIQQVNANAEKLMQESEFLKALGDGRRQEMLQEAVNLLYPDESKKWEVGDDDVINGTRLKNKDLESNHESGRQVGQ